MTSKFTAGMKVRGEFSAGKEGDKFIAEGVIMEWSEVFPGIDHEELLTDFEAVQYTNIIDDGWAGNYDEHEMSEPEAGEFGLFTHDELTIIE